VLGAREANQHQDTQRAAGEDFCGIFEENMAHFYLLSFLLTADRRMAEECFVRGLEDSARSNRVFKEWADSWARRTIIHNAIQMIRPAPTGTSTSSSGSDGSERQLGAEPAEISAIVALAAFDRFAFVMSVLERHSDQECALLLGCTRDEVTAARGRALQQIGKLATLPSKAPTGASTERALHPGFRSILPFEAVSQLTVSS